MPNTENLQKGITSLEFRIAALAARLTTAKSTGPGESPRDISRQINEYGRTLAILQRQLAASKEVSSKLSQTEDLLHNAWGIIANVVWSDETPEWQMAVLNFRDSYHELLLDLE